MKSYRIVYGDTISVKDLRKIDPSVLRDIKAQIEEKLTMEPDRYGKPLRKSLKGYRRLRIGPYRVIFKIQDEEVKVVFIGKKPKVYGEFLRRIRVSRLSEFCL